MQMMPTQPHKYAYSYLRFSSPEQMKGDSVRRQTFLAAAYANEFGLTLDDQLTYQDYGISSFRGQNAASGRLGDFLAAVSAGIVPIGSVLLVENLDRLSRESALHAQNLLTQIVLAGVSIVTLSDRRTYSIDELRRDPMGLIYALINFIRANEESELKSFRGKASWSAKRAIADTKPMSASCPKWLRLDRETSRFIVLSDRAKIVQRIFRLRIAGHQPTAIANALNRTRTPTWYSATQWTRTNVGAILRFSAVIGTFVPHKNEWENGRPVRRAFEPIPNYYPSIITPAVFMQAQACRVGNPRAGHGSVGHVLNQLAVCALCNAPMANIRRGLCGPPSIICSAAKGGLECPYREVDYAHLENAIRTGLRSLLRGSVPEDSGNGRSTALSRAQNAVDRERRAVLSNLADGKDGERSIGPAEAARRLHEAENDLLETVESYHSRAEKQQARQWAHLSALVDGPPWGSAERTTLNVALRRMLERVVIDPWAGTVAIIAKGGARFVVSV